MPRLKLKTKLLLAITGMVFALVLALSCIYVSQLIDQRLTEADSNASFVAHQVLDAARKALETDLGPAADSADPAKLHETIALVLLFERRFHEAEAESAEGLKELQSLARADAGETVAAYLTHGCALCHQGRCSAALEDANRAMAIAQAKLPAESLDMVAVWLFRGFDEWKTGSAEEGERAMGEALRIARGLTGLPRPVLVNAQLGVLRQYAAFLKATHRKREAGQTESEIVRLESEQHLACSNGTVNAAALSAGPLLP